MSVFRTILFCLLFFSNNSIAQFQVSPSDLIPEINEQFVINYCSYFGPGESGENVVWDFRTIKADSSYTETYTNPNPDFPGSTHTLVISKGNLPTENYLKMDEMGFELFGSKSGNGMVSSYVNPKKSIQFPLSYGALFGDQFSLDTFYMGTYPYIIEGEINLTADGYGTLLTPTGLFTNVIRLKAVENTVLQNLSVPTSQTYSFSTSYYWYSPKLHHFVAMTEESSSGPVSAKSGYYLESQVKTGNTISIYPNPAPGGVFQIDFPKNVIDYDLRFTDMQGQQIDVSSYFVLSSLYIEDARLLAGTYFMHCTDSEGEVTVEKIVVI